MYAFRLNDIAYHIKLVVSY